LSRPEDQIEAAIAVRGRLQAMYFHAMPSALETLAWVRERRYRSALISMRSPNTHELWRASPFAGLIELEVFSCEVGLRSRTPRSTSRRRRPA
jgi:hypothetical protein